MFNIDLSEIPIESEKIQGNVSEIGSSPYANYYAVVELDGCGNFLCE
jgi:hypothetical protein